MSINSEASETKEQPKDRPVLYIMCGLPFSGKSFLSRQIASELGIELLSYDQQWVVTKEANGRELSYEELMAFLQEKIRKDLKSGQSVVFDTLNDTVGNRDKLREIADEVNAQAVVIYTDTPAEVIQERREQNKNTKERHSVPENKLSEAVARFEPPVEKERVKIFKPGDDLSAFISNLREEMKDEQLGRVIVIGSSLSGKSTLIKNLRDGSGLVISEIDEELVGLNSGKFPEEGLKQELGRKIAADFIR